MPGNAITHFQIPAEKLKEILKWLRFFIVFDAYTLRGRKTEKYFFGDSSFSAQKVPLISEGLLSLHRYYSSANFSKRGFAKCPKTFL